MSAATYASVMKPYYSVSSATGSLIEVVDYLTAKSDSGSDYYGDPVNNPYTDVVPYDPDDDLARVRADVSAVHARDTNVADAVDRWEENFTRVQDLWDGTFDADYINDEVDAFELQTRPQHLQALNRFAASMGTLGASGATTFGLGIATLEKARLDIVNDYRSKLNVAHVQTRMNALFQTAGNLSDLLLKDAAMVIDEAKLRIVAKNEEFSVAQDIDVKWYRWDLDVLMDASQVVGAITGATSSRMQEPSKFQSAVGGLLTGASAGAMIGWAIKGAAGGVPGMIIGGAIGLAGGLFS